MNKLAFVIVLVIAAANAGCRSTGRAPSVEAPSPVIPTERELLTFPLDDVTGEFPYEDSEGQTRTERSQVITYTGPSGRVLDISVTLEGSTFSGSQVCLLGRGSERPLSANLSSEISATSAFGKWKGSPGKIGDGEFTVVSELKPAPRYRFEFLRKGDEVLVTQWCGTVMGPQILACTTTREPGGTLYSAELRIHVEYVDSSDQ